MNGLMADPPANRHCNAKGWHLFSPFHLLYFLACIENLELRGLDVLFCKKLILKNSLQIALPASLSPTFAIQKEKIQNILVYLQKTQIQLFLINIFIYP